MIKGRLDCSGALYWWQMIQAAWNRFAGSAYTSP